VLLKSEESETDCVISLGEMWTAVCYTIATLLSQHLVPVPCRVLEVDLAALTYNIHNYENMSSSVSSSLSTTSNQKERNIKPYLPQYPHSSHNPHQPFSATLSSKSILSP
jgi:hypothetical protein